MSSDDTNEAEIKKIDDIKPVVWTPEDASRFLTSAINEAQRPLADALKNRPITTKGLYLLVGSLLVAGLVIVLILSGQVERAEKRAAIASDKHEQTFAEKHEIQAQHSTLQDRLSLVNDQHEELRGQVEALRKKEEIHKKTQTDLSRFRRHNDALRSQISGLEMEKAALARQLDALKIMMEDPDEAGPDDNFEDDVDSEHPFEGGYAIEDQNGPEQAAPIMAAPDESVSAPPAVQESTVAEETVSETSSINTGDTVEKSDVSAPEAVETEPAAVSAAPLQTPSSDTESYSEQAEAVRSILLLADESTEETASLPDKYHTSSGSGEADGSESVAESMTDASGAVDPFAATAEAYAESLAHQQQPDVAVEATESVAGEGLLVEEVAETSESSAVEGEKARMTPAEFVEKIGEVVEQIREKVTP